ncbi:MAG: 30S ribosomal protein S6 [Tenericutes bacterium]|nr:30S ribosomal protein S6 [Mycoplasmatota bacterium]
MNKYEIMFIVKADLSEDEEKATVKSFEKVLTDMGAKIINSKDLGQKKLAYEIKKQVRGYYHLLNVECDSKAVKEFDRKALIDEKIIRHLIIKEEE